jgi:hypothetical protein
VRCETVSALWDGCRNVKKAYIFASCCEDVHKGWARRMSLWSRGARKETVHGVLDSGPFGMAGGGSSAIVASRWRMWIKLSKDGETCIERTVSHGLTPLKNLLVCIGARLGWGCWPMMVFCRSEVRICGERRGRKHTLRIFSVDYMAGQAEVSMWDDTMKEFAHLLEL